MLEHISWRSYKNQPVGFWVNAVTGREIEFTFLMERDGCTRHVNSHLDEPITDPPIFLRLNFSFVLPNTKVSMEFTKDNFIKFLLSNDVRKLTARFQISIGYAKYLATRFCNIKRNGADLLFWLLFSTKYTLLYSSNAANLTLHVRTLQIVSQHQKTKNCRIHIALIDRSTIGKRGDIWAEKSVWWTDERRFKNL